MRLTTHQSVMGRNRKHDIAHGMGSIWLKKIGKYKYELIEGVIDKLGQLEDIEDELGIDLITLFKAQTEGFYVKTVCGIFSVLLREWRFDLIKKEIHRITFSDHYYFKDYGKTWALTKEELE